MLPIFVWPPSVILLVPPLHNPIHMQINYQEIIASQIGHYPVHVDYYRIITTSQIKYSKRETHQSHRRLLESSPDVDEGLAELPEGQYN